MQGGIMLRRTLYSEEHALFRDSIRKFYAKELVPKIEQWETDGIVDRDFWRACGINSLLLPDIPEQYGGSGQDFRFNAIILEETALAGTTGPAFGVHNDIVAHYILNHGTEEQKQRYLPKMVSGECVGAVAMTEPGAGSDLQGVRTSAKPASAASSGPLETNQPAMASNHPPSSDGGGAGYCITTTVTRGGLHVQFFFLFVCVSYFHNLRALHRVG